jgi:hypothetical protein
MYILIYKPTKKTMINRTYSNKERAISELIETANQQKINLYLRKTNYGNNNCEYRIVTPEEVMCYDADNYIGHYLYHSHTWIAFNPADRINIPQSELKRKDTIVIPVLSSERPGFSE